jgi:hypothetical protein
MLRDHFTRGFKGNRTATNQLVQKSWIAGKTGEFSFMAKEAQLFTAEDVQRKSFLSHFPSDNLARRKAVEFKNAAGEYRNSSFTSPLVGLIVATQSEQDLFPNVGIMERKFAGFGGRGGFS